MALRLVPGTPEHAEIFLQWRNEPSTQLYNPVMPLNLEQLRTSLAEEGADLSRLWDHTRHRWFVKWNDQSVANVSIVHPNPMMKTAEIAYGVGQGFQGKGFGYASVRLLVEKVFRETELRKLIAFVHHENIPKGFTDGYLLELPHPKTYNCWSENDCRRFRSHRLQDLTEEPYRPHP